MKERRNRLKGPRFEVSLKPSARYLFKGKLMPLEERMLLVVWHRGTATVREIVEGDGHRLAYTTVMTTLDRLFKKGLLGRSQEGLAFRYEAAVSREDFWKERAVHAWRTLLTASPDSNLALSFLVNTLSEEDSQMLGDLERLVERKRHEIR